MRTFVLALALLISFQSFTQQEDIAAFEYLHTKGEVYFKFQYEDRQDIIELANIISLDKVGENDVYAYANHKEFIKFLTYGLPFTVEPHPGDRLKNPPMYDGTKGIWDFDTYPTYSEYETMMYSFETNYPNICEIVQIGTSTEGRKLLFAKISDNVGTNEAEPKFIYNSAMHGDEVVGYVLMLRLIDYLLTNYGSDADVNELVNGIEIWIMPLENPDGTFAGGDHTVSGATRYNANNVDLNRNFKNPVGGDNPDGESWQPETIAMMEFSDTMHFTFGGNWHGGAELINYPWDTWYSSENAHADTDWWEYVGTEYATHAQDDSPAGYLTGEGDGVTHGADWYKVYGTEEDYINYYTHGRMFIIEGSNVKILDESELVAHWNYNFNAMMAQMKQTLNGVHGIIRDSVTHEPLAGMAYIEGHDKDNSESYSYLPHGDYYRLLYQGTYDITYSAPGYRSKTYTVSVTNDTGIEQIADLVNLETVPPLANFSVNLTTLTCSGAVEFTNLTETFGTTTYLWDFGDGNTATDENPTHTYTSNGVFTVTLTATNANGNNTRTMTNYITVDLPMVNEVNSASICESSGSMTLSAYGEGTMYWFDVPAGGTSFHTGNTYTTPVLTSSTTYYVEDHTGPSLDYVGKTDNSGSGGYFDNNSEWGLVFDCFEASTLQSVKVYAGSGGNRTIYLKTSTGTILDQITVNIPNGESRVDLNFDIPVGTDLEITADSNPDLYRNNDGAADYPYELPGKITITKSNLPDMYGPTDYYYFFYDWEIVGEECVSERVPVYAVINEAPVADFDFYVVSGYEVQFNNNSVNGVTYEWNFDDGSTSTDAEPNHTYTDPIVYNVQLIAYNDCGSDTTYLEVDMTGMNVSETISEQILIYPNPTSNTLNIDMQALNGSRTVRVFDVYGNILYLEELEENHINISTGNWAAGVYILTISTDKHFVTKEIIKK